MISRAKDARVSPDAYLQNTKSSYDQYRQKTGEIYKEYMHRLHMADAMDFDDLLRMTVYLFQACPEVLENYQNRFQYIMVDEYQDTNNAQFELVKLLAGKRKNICEEMQ